MRVRLSNMVKEVREAMEDGRVEELLLVPVVSMGVERAGADKRVDKVGGGKEWGEGNL
jgi:hypothetical protein